METRFVCTYHPLTRIIEILLPLLKLVWFFLLLPPPRCPARADATQEIDFTREKKLSYREDKRILFIKRKFEKEDIK